MTSRSTKYEIRWKYTRNRPRKLGEIRNSDTLTIYFTERSEVYFYGISTVFLSNYFTERSEVYFYGISTVSLSNYFTERSEVYFYGISTVFLSNYFTEPSAAGRRSEVYFYGISTVSLSNYFTERSEVYFYSISTVFLSNYFTEPSAAGRGSEVYFYPIPIVSHRLDTSYLILDTFKFGQLPIPFLTVAQYKTHQSHFLEPIPYGPQLIQSLCPPHSPKTF